MSEELKARLREILLTAQSDDFNVTIDEAVAQIEGALQDECYWPLDSIVAKEYYRRVFAQEGLKEYPLPYKFLPGPRFYDRFLEEIPSGAHDKETFIALTQAARRAAGMDEQ